MTNKAGESAESILKKLRRLDANMICPNCGTPGQRGIGFGNVCVKFSTFICDLCKTSHQAISHQVKSITMSNWTMEEVNKLMDQRGGGNAAAQHIWLANAPAFGGKYAGGQRPKQGDRVEIFKQFVLDAYEYGKFRANIPYVPPSAAAASEPVAVSAPSPSARPAPALVPPTTLPAVSNTASVTADFDFFNSTDAALGRISPLPPHQSKPSCTSNSRSTAQSVSVPSQKQSYPAAQVPQEPFFVPDFAQFDVFSGANSQTPVNSAPAPAQSRAVPASAHLPPRPPPPMATISTTTATKSSTASLIDLLDEPAMSRQTSPFLSSCQQQQPPAAHLPNTHFDPFGATTGITKNSVNMSSSTSNLLDFFQGMSFDAPATGTNTNSSSSNARVMSAQSQPVMLRSSPMMMPMTQSHTPPMMVGGGGMSNGMGIRNWNYMGNSNAIRPSRTMMSDINGGTNCSNCSLMTSTMLPMNTGGGNAALGGYQYSNNNSMRTTSNNNSFDFLQDTMRKHLDSAARSTPSNNNNTSSKHIHPFP